MKKIKLNAKWAFVSALIVCVMVPIVLNNIERRARVDDSSADVTLNIITSHNETIRIELGEAFQEWWKEETGETVYVNWLISGGTSEARRTLDSKFSVAQNRGEEGIGVDVLFGGGDFEFRSHAEQGHLDKLDVFSDHSEWFQDDVIPASFTGETYYDAEQRWTGVCLSRFGICYNVDVLKRLGMEPPCKWEDLADPKYFGKLALADPSKSGSVARAFEMIFQQQIQKSKGELKQEAGETEFEYEMRARREGWDKGLFIIQRICANARYFTDSSAKVPYDVAQGDAAAGMCIDFYGLAYEEKLKKADGNSRMQWSWPEGGTSVSADPVAVFKGAPQRETAQGFVKFLMSKQGQVLWNMKPNVAGGTKYRALRRMPIRKDVYTDEYMKGFTDPISPYEKISDGEGFEYQAELTGGGFYSIQFVIRVLCIDLHEELRAAWSAMIEADVPERAELIFSDTAPVSYQNTMGHIRGKISQGSKIGVTNMARHLNKYFRKNYAKAAAISKEELGKR